MKVSIVGSLRDREVACSASDRPGLESCVWRTVSSQSSHHPQEVLLAQFSLYVHKGGLKPESFYFLDCNCLRFAMVCCITWTHIITITLAKNSALSVSPCMYTLSRIGTHEESEREETTFSGLQFYSHPSSMRFWYIMAE